MSKESKAYKNMPKKVCIRTFGCQMNIRDSEVICGLLKGRGYKLVKEPDKADIVLLNTCSVRQHAEDKVWSEIGRIAKRNTPYSIRNTKKSRPIIGVIGCMAQNYKEKIFERAPEVDFVVGPSDIHKIPKIIKKIVTSQKSQVTSEDLFERKIWETEGNIRPEEIYHTGFYGDKNHTYVVISEGCSNFCSYCVVPYVRGTLRNRNYKDILREIEEALEAGINRITLIGQNVNAYVSNPKSKTPNPKLEIRDLDKKINFIELLRMVNDIKGLKEFSFITSHPKDTSLDLFRAMADLGKLKKYLHLPVQSGSDRILKLMNRNYTRSFYLYLVDNYRKIVKDSVLTTDVIVGFPTETEKDFRQTHDLIKKIGFDAAYIFKYSTRPHTEAEKLNDDVPKKEKERRHRIILELQKEISNKRKVQSEKCKTKV